tara:strand:+ start:983 stop:2257 length:1275 start_codon:yes stop_codon:yes gene_type:complete
MFDIFCMQMGGQTNLPAHTQFTRYNNTHLATIKRIVKKANTEYVWVVSDICDYSNFDFTWQPTPWEADQIHCWASDDQQYGDTFLIPVSAFKRQLDDLKVLGWYRHINWHANGVPRTTLGNMYNWILANNQRKVNFNPPLWEKRAIHVFNKSGSVLLVPRDCKSHFLTQYYDYPYILRHNHIKCEDKPLDIVFISNGEKNADLNWNHLKKVHRNNKCKNNLKRSNGVNGRTQAYKAAASLSETEWFYAVFAKTEVLESFHFDLYPDYLQETKHYMLHSRNPLNGLEYGAMNINLYNKQLTLDTDAGLDFTLSSNHDTIPIVASISRFNEDPWITWRSAFREVLKLKREVDLGDPRPEIKYRLKTWCSKAQGENAEWCLQGANDALKYYKSAKGSYNALLNSYDWPWLKTYFEERYDSITCPTLL